MLDKVTIAYRGAGVRDRARAAITSGSGPLDGPRSQPMEAWPETQEGWSAAWTRFSALEGPETITPAAEDRAPGGSLTAAAACPAATAGAGSVAGDRRGARAAVAARRGRSSGVFPALPHTWGASLASSPDNLTART